MTQRNTRDCSDKLTGDGTPNTSWTITNLTTDTTIDCNLVTGAADIVYGDAIGSIVRQLIELGIFSGTTAGV